YKQKLLTLKQASFSQVSDKISAYNKIVKSQGNLFGHISKQNLTCNIFAKTQVLVGQVSG
uniref:hypothetical protein n=1 Tax=Klebsiella quasipneumoniae TaxID=1463165 RepID=UPI001BB29D9A